MSEADGGTEASSWTLGPVVEALCAANAELLRGRRRKLGQRALPSRTAIEGIFVDLRAALFPGHFGASDLSDQGIQYYVGHTLDAALIALQEQVRHGLLFACTHRGDGDCEACARQAIPVTQRFGARLPGVRALLGSDARAAYEGDPAATSADEALLCYPGLTAIIHHRLAHELYALGVPLVPRILSELAHGATGIDIHPGARIGASFFIDHGTGVVIGETCVIGERVRIYQGVTLGAKSFPTDDEGLPIKGIPRHPIVEDDVVVYAGATILGRITIGRGSSIGGNVWLTHSVAPGSRVSQAQPRHELFDGGSGIEALVTTLVFVDHALAARIEAAQTASLAGIARAVAAQLPEKGAAVATLAGGCAAFAGPNITVSRAVGLGMSGPVEPADVDALERFYRDRDADASILVSPFAHPSLLDQLGERGFRLAQLDSVLVRRLAPRDTLPAVPDEIAVRVAPLEDAAAWVRASLAGFTPEGEAPALDRAPVFEAGFHAEGYGFLWASVGGVAAGGAGLRVEGMTGYFFADSTLTAFRGRGVQGALIAARLADARAAGCDLAFALTAAGSASQRNYERAGFTPVYSQALLVKRYETRTIS